MKYRVMRQDDNANIFEVEPLCSTREEAEALQHKLEKGHHKQDYWIVPVEERNNQDVQKQG